MEGVLHIEGPALNWLANKAELRIPRLQLGPAPGVGIAAEAPTLTNSGPVVVRFANSTLTVESAHLVGRGTDLNLSGRVLTEQKNPLDLRVDGRLDLALLQSFSSDFVSASPRSSPTISFCHYSLRSSSSSHWPASSRSTASRTSCPGCSRPSRPPPC